MDSDCTRASFFDTSALVRLYVDEPGSESLRHYFDSEATKFTTQFCFYETLNILKSKWLHQNKLTRDQYLDASLRLMSWYRFMRQTIRDLDLTEPTVFFKTTELAERTNLDLSDALQILNVGQGDFSCFCEGSKTVFVTADKTLAQIARSEGLRVWSILEESPPC